MKTIIQFWTYNSSLLFLEWKMFQTKFVKKIETQILCLIIFFFKSRRLWGNVEKYCIAGLATDDNTAHAPYILDT